MEISKAKSHLTASAELRRKAEERLVAKTAKLRPPRSEEVMQMPPHDLEVRQAEQETRNDEPFRAREELMVSRNPFDDLYGVPPVGYFSFETSGLIGEVNLPGRQLLGIQGRLPADKQFVDFIADAKGREIFSHHLESVLQRQGIQSCEIELKGKDGMALHGLFKSVAMSRSESESRYILSSIIDGTPGSQAAEERHKAHAGLKSIAGKWTSELTSANVQLTQEIDERKRAEESLQGAYSEVKRLKDRLQAENIYLQQEVAQDYDFGEIIGQSEILTQLFLRVEQVAAMNATVLLLGETGTGKAVVAHAIHGSSSRRDRPMITVNCAALPANLIESELFGWERGALTGADSRQIGRFELADGGTIFLNNVDNMTLELQRRLLRIIQDGEFERLGSPSTIKIDVRVIAASNRNLKEAIRDGRFREDLFYRLNVFPITIPPLRQRKEDIPLLVNQFIAKFNRQVGRKIETVSQNTLNALQQYDWPGNVRELESVIERAVITSQGNTLRIVDRFDTLLEPAGGEVKALVELEHDHILHVLQKTGWRIEGKNGAAELLGLNASTLRARMRKYGIIRR